jgi:hypothetical protein
MHVFSEALQKYSNKGEKTGWTFVVIPDNILINLKLKNKRAFRIKGFADAVHFEKLSVYPVGEGVFVIAFNSILRRKLKKEVGAQVTMKIELDESKAAESPELIECLEAEPQARIIFEALKNSQRNYFHNYIIAAKSSQTKTARIVHVINALFQSQDFGEMIRSLKKK